jgi:DNA-binding MarR family transcriptional regulator
LQSEIRQGRPFVSLSQEGAVAILRTADVVRRQVAVVLEPSGITPQQYNVLRILRGAGPNGLPTLEIAVRMVERAPGITGLLDRLEAKEMIRRDRKAGDRRCVVCRITDAGLELLGGLDDPIERADRLLFGAFSEDDLRHLLAILQAVRSGASASSRHEPGPGSRPVGAPGTDNTSSGPEAPRNEPRTANDTNKTSTNKETP